MYMVLQIILVKISTSNSFKILKLEDSQVIHIINHADYGD